MGLDDQRVGLSHNNGFITGKDELKNGTFCLLKCEAQAAVKLE